MKFALVAAIALLMLPLAARAQALGDLGALGGGSVPELTLSFSPQAPQPYGTLTVTPESTLLDLHNATITLSQDGAQIYQGNAAPVSVTLPGPGRKTLISAVATIAGDRYTASLTLFPGAVALVEEPLSSAPALYPGKPLLPDGGSVRLVAVPDFETAPGVKIAPAALSYTWSADGATLDSASGIGKQAIVLAAPLPYRASSVSVAVKSQDGLVQGAAELSLSSAEPTLRLYEDDPLMGILFERALGGAAALSGSEGSIAAVPYSFAISQGPPALQWFLDGAPVEAGSVITLRPTGQGSGTAALSATASAAGANTTAAASLSISFASAAGSAGLFGL
jgi:hypothetical protein